MGRRQGLGQRLVRVATLIVLAGLFASPLLWMVVSAFKPRAEIFRLVYPFSWKTLLPVDFTLANFVSLFEAHGFARAIVNSVFVATATSLLAVVVCSATAYCFARIPFRGREAVFALVIATLFLPFEALMVPMFFVVQRLGLNDSYLALILPWIADPFLIFFLRQHFKGLPRELEDAAVVDGCSILQTYRLVMLPNIKPALATAIFIKFFFSWDAYVWPLIVIRDQDKTVLTVAIAKLFTDQGALWGEVFAAGALATIPLVVMFLALQRQYVASIASSGIKG